MLHITLFFFLLTALSGVWMRLYVFSQATQWLPYENLLHAHSHVAILGWTFFAVFLIFAVLVRAFDTTYVKIVSVLLLIVTTLMFTAFLAQGYAMYSIIFSTLHIFLEYAVAYFIISHVRRNEHIPQSSRYFMYGSVVMLIISSLGPFSLGAIAASGLRESSIFDMAIYFYLHFQYNGWLTLILIGMFLYMLKQKRINYSETLMKRSFWLYFTALFPSFFLSILWYDFGFIGISLAIIGIVGQISGLVFLFVAFYRIRQSFQRAVTRLIYVNMYIVMLLLACKSVMEIGLLHLPFAELIYETRPVVIGYLHLTLLGFISIFILVQCYVLQLVNEKLLLVKLAVSVFLFSFILNEFVLFLSGLFSWLQFGAIPLNNHLLLLASVLLLISIVSLWLSIRR